jgi:CDP-diacylglycerol--glycerol-3-phosphate 3-phosphatidyltransferase
VREAEITPATIVTVIRILLIPVVMVLILQDLRWEAAGVYVLAAATDSLDGWLARSRGQVTVAGAFLDPLADKLLVTAALLALIQTGDLQAWIAMVIITREFAVTGLRMIAVSEKLVIPANRWGKYKAVSQNAAILAVMTPHPWKWIDPWLLGVAVVLTVLSGILYFVFARQQLASRDRSEPPMTAGS